jgi:hypothetical protein
VHFANGDFVFGKGEIGEVTPNDIFFGIAQHIGHFTIYKGGNVIGVFDPYAFIRSLNNELVQVTSL